jgi:hypothetical protein
MERGADKTLRTGRGFTPLMLAAAGDCPELVDELLFSEPVRVPVHA